MRYALFSDVHGNMEALEAVLEAVEAESPDKYIFLGDIVGYGASPNAVMETIRTLRPFYGVRGNHDKVVMEVDQGEGFRQYAKQAALWTRERLTIANRRFLEQLPQGPLVVDDQIVISHGSPHDEDFYILTEADIAVVLQTAQHWLTFFGHTHIPLFASLTENQQCEAECPADTQDYKLLKNRRYLVNPGSVGQPRDHDPNASFALLDTEVNILTIHRIPYDIEAAQKKILEAGLNPFLAERLARGR